jgi:hypothetical protein
LEEKEVEKMSEEKRRKSLDEVISEVGPMYKMDSR